MDIGILTRMGCGSDGTPSIAVEHSRIHDWAARSFFLWRSSGNGYYY